VRGEAERKGESEGLDLGARRGRDAEGVTFETLLEQEEAKRLLNAALPDEPAHAYLFHGPAGVGKRIAALAFAGELLGDRERVERRAHPDLYLLEPLGDQIRIDEVRELRRDLHMRPFEAERRVYLVFGAHLLNAEAADALLKDLEEPPPYAVVVLVADELGPVPETIRSRCQLVPFRRLSERAIRAEIDRRAPGLAPDQATAFARVAAGRLDRVERLLDPEAARRREELIEIARAVYRDPSFDPSAAAQAVLGLAAERAAEARTAAEEALAGRELPEREAEQYVRRAERGAERDEVLLALEELAAWYRDLVVVGVEAERAVIHFDRLAELTGDAGVDRIGAEWAAESVREAWRAFEEFNVSPPLALEALFVRLRRELAGVPASV
jgi:DNA polymerase III subunit delta'